MGPEGLDSFFLFAWIGCLQARGRKAHAPPPCPLLVHLPAHTASFPTAPARRLDSLVGLFAAKCAPTATADPYGLRRAAVGMLQASGGKGFYS